eukprot:TRINITY_DN21991_c0_g1_i1.p1 TRINITY_DN21991_c0_g1~~TRINITY_DN21991_c0_g1_i1.p1  ORF type:complete len:202 (+),score=11.85 TRINITY_DN21991_c0_g1_i1:43-648(+)
MKSVTLITILSMSILAFGCQPPNMCWLGGTFKGVAKEERTLSGDITCEDGEPSPSYVHLGCNVEVVVFRANRSIVEGHLDSGSAAGYYPFVSCVGDGNTTFSAEYTISYPICVPDTESPESKLTIPPTMVPTKVPTQVPTQMPTTVPVLGDASSDDLSIPLIVFIVFSVATIIGLGGTLAYCCLLKQRKPLETETELQAAI